MAEESKNREATSERRPEQSGADEAEEILASPMPDAAHTVTQPTSYKLAPSQQARGGVPEGRFTEEVVRGSEEDSGEGWDTHPEENQPVKGIDTEAGDELPDTTGRAALKAEKK